MHSLNKAEKKYTAQTSRPKEFLRIFVAGRLFYLSRVSCRTICFKIPYVLMRLSRTVSVNLEPGSKDDLPQLPLSSRRLGSQKLAVPVDAQAVRSARFRLLRLRSTQLNDEDDGDSSRDIDRSLQNR